MKFSFLLLFSLCLRQIYSNEQFKSGPFDKREETFQLWYENFYQWVEEASQGKLQQNVLNVLTLSLWIIPEISLELYDNEDLLWTRTSFVQPQIMLHDRFLYDRETNSWTVDKYLQDLKDRYGGIDSVLLWQGYPNIGIDDRNQFDMLKSLPGGIEGLRQLTNDFLRNGVKVLLPYLPWDQGTRPNEQNDITSLVDIIIASNISGMNGDTMDGVNGSFWQEAQLHNYTMAIGNVQLFVNLMFILYFRWRFKIVCLQTKLAPLAVCKKI